MIRIRNIFSQNTIQDIAINQNTGYSSTKGSLHLSLRRILLIFRATGLLPIQGLRHQTGDKLRFKWFSLATFHYGGCFLGVLLLNLFVYNDVYHKGMQYVQISTLVILVSCIWTILVMLKISQNWSQVVLKADILLENVPAFDSNVEKRCFYMVIGFIFLGLSDYVIYTVHCIRITYACNQNLSPMYGYYTVYISWVFDYIPFNYWFGALYQIIECLVVFILYFKDIIIIVFSIYVSELFCRLNKIILEEKIKPPWNELRMHYTKLNQLVELLDEQISSLVLLSHLCNMFHICHELFQLIDDVFSQGLSSCFMGNTQLALERALFHAFSLSCMVIRALLTSLLPARVHTMSRNTLDALHDIPAAEYDLNVQKFMDQVYYSKVGFTGLGFFYVTREIILSMIVTVTTYELVLLQFHNI